MPHLLATITALPMRCHNAKASCVPLQMPSLNECIFFAQVLEATACRAVLALGSSSAMISSGLLDMTAPATNLTAVGDPSAIMDWCMLEWLPRLKEWSLLAFLICPGERAPCRKHQSFPFSWALCRCCIVTAPPSIIDCQNVAFGAIANCV